MSRTAFVPRSDEVVRGELRRSTAVFMVGSPFRAFLQARERMSRHAISLGAPATRGSVAGSVAIAPCLDGMPLARKCREPGLGDLRIMIRSVEACADAANDLSIDDDWKTTFHLGEIARRHRREPALIDFVLDRFGRLLEER